MQPPTVDISSPNTGDELFGPNVTIATSASDPGGSGVKEVRVYWQHCPGGTCGVQKLIGAVTSSPYNVVWTLPVPCPTPGNLVQIRARAEDKCGNVSLDFVVGARLGNCPAFRGDVRSSPAGTWVSELTAPGARGQVVVDGTEAVFPGGGMEAFSVRVGPGPHRFEATLVDGAGRPGAWRFDLSALGLLPGSLRVVAGEAAPAGSAAVVFRLRGKPGERVVFTFDVGGGQ